MYMSYKISTRILLYVECTFWRSNHSELSINDSQLFERTGRRRLSSLQRSNPGHEPPWHCGAARADVPSVDPFVN